MATNQVYVFARTPPSLHSYVAEIRSTEEKGSQKSSTLYVNMLARGAEKSAGGQYIRASLPYINQDIPIVVLFRALGVIPDKDILDHICYDPNDHQMMEMLKPCIEEGFVIQEQRVALDFIGRRGSAIGATERKRVE